MRSPILSARFRLIRRAHDDAGGHPLAAAIGICNGVLIAIALWCLVAAVWRMLT